VAGAKLQAPRGTFDVKPGEGAARLSLFNLCQSALGTAGLEYVETPAFEHTDLFARGVGESTDIVQKEMFTFEDKAGRSLTLRPEGTAGVCRSYVENGMHKLPQPVRVWYWGPYFRHEAPQAGRFRQFTQVGVEAIGSDDPTLDAEMIALLAHILREAGVRGARLRLSSLGTADTRREYLDELGTYLRAHQDELSPEVVARIESNPLRAFDSADEGTGRVVAGAPRLLDRLAADDAAHFAEVRALLDEAGIEYQIDPTLVRGLDYYTRTVFEFTSDALGAQSGVGGGGRYDGLVEQLGGPPTPGIGWAAGVERILLAAGDTAQPAWPITVFVARAGEGDTRRAFGLVHALRRGGVAAQMEQAGRSLKGQMKQADRVRARFAVVVSDEGMELTDLRTRTARPVDGPEDVLQAVRDW